MSEIVNVLLEKYKALLADDDSISTELIIALELELAKESPNSESLAELIKKPKKLET
jgi:hypothetical protein